MKNIILVILLLISKNLFFQEDTHKILYDVKTWRLDYSFYVDKKLDFYIIDKPHSKKDYNKSRVSELDEAEIYIVFDSSSRKVEYKKNFITVFDEKKMITVDKLVDSIFTFASGNYNIEYNKNETILSIRNYINLEQSKSYNYSSKIIILNTETLVLLKDGGYIEVYNNHQVDKGKSIVEKDDYFIFYILCKYFDKKEIPYKINNNIIIQNALDDMDKGH